MPLVLTRAVGGSFQVSVAGQDPHRLTLAGVAPRAGVVTLELQALSGPAREEPPRCHTILIGRQLARLEIRGVRFLVDYAGADGFRNQHKLAFHAPREVIVQRSEIVERPRRTA